MAKVKLVYNYIIKLLLVLIGSIDEKLRQNGNRMRNKKREQQQGNEKKNSEREMACKRRRQHTDRQQYKIDAG